MEKSIEEICDIESPEERRQAALKAALVIIDNCPEECKPPILNTIRELVDLAYCIKLWPDKDIDIYNTE